MKTFQLTPSRRATAGQNAQQLFRAYFNSRPHGGRRSGELRSRGRLHISTHALTEGDRRRSHAGHCVEAHFNSRPHGGRRTHGQKHREKRTISTHALTEGDLPSFMKPINQITFQLTPSRRATQRRPISSYQRSFQLTPSRRATRPVTGKQCGYCNFNSRPHGGRQPLRKRKSFLTAFQLTPSRRATERDLVSLGEWRFQLTPSRRATETKGGIRKLYTFQLTPSRRATS